MRRQKIIPATVSRSLYFGLYQRILFVKPFGVYLFCVHRRKDAKTVISEPHVITIAGTPGRDDPPSFHFPHEFSKKRRYHGFLLRHTPKPHIRFNGHTTMGRATVHWAKIKAIDLKSITCPRESGKRRLVPSGIPFQAERSVAHCELDRRTPNARLGHY